MLSSSRINRIQRTLIFVILLMVTTGCQFIPPLPETTPSATPGPAPGYADVTIFPGKGESAVTVNVGQTMAVIAPDLSVDWKLEFGPEYFELIEAIPASSPQRPQQWLLKALRAGENNLYLTSSSTCPQGEECPPAAREIIVTVHIILP